eukprot:6983229-Prymnesium_polylepis.1
MHASELPENADDHPKPARPSHPHKACEEREARSSQLQLYVDRYVARRRRGCRPGRRRHR